MANTTTMIALAVGITMFCAGYLTAANIHRALGDRSKWEDVDPFEFTRRAQAMQVHHDRLLGKVNQLGVDAHAAIDAGDLATSRRLTDKMNDLKVESDLILNNIRELRLEQIECQHNGWRRLRQDAIEAPR